MAVRSGSLVGGWWQSCSGGDGGVWRVSAFGAWCVRRATGVRSPR